MLFNSYSFIFIFLPLVLFGYYYLGFKRVTLGLYWLILCSLFFYGCWNPSYLILLLGSIGLNYIIGYHVVKRRSKKILTLGISLNLGLLAYYKYAHFILGNLNHVFESVPTIEPVLLPLAISFFTFQQIAYLVDLYQGKITQGPFKQYFLFISFFPQLIAGPIVHYQEMMPQFQKQFKMSKLGLNLSIGLTIFIMGLFKKVVLADTIAPFANQVFNAAEAGVHLTPVESWLGALAYTFQLYFDFSGYTDMAIGLAHCCGIRLPLNFHSPYKATSIIEFWRRWHMTLSRFLRDYLYIPLGGNQKGEARRYGNLLITMLLGGLWHGAGWTFIFWGGLHGIYLMINHAYQKVWGRSQHKLFKLLGGITTFLAVVVAWVFFKAATLEGAWHLLTCMFNWQGELLPAFFGRTLPFLSNWGIMANGPYANAGHVWPKTMLWLGMMSLIIWCLPNTQQWMRRYRPAYEKRIQISQGLMINWRPNAAYAVGLSLITVLTLMSMSRISEFLYYQF